LGQSAQSDTGSLPTSVIYHHLLHSNTTPPRRSRTRADLSYSVHTRTFERNRWLRREAGILVTNPDMLHLGILPNHTLWADFFANLRFVVIDEAHVYRGVFGSHVG
jgi:ATP-dependent helicase YprA (DUF1998 family)